MQTTFLIESSSNRRLVIFFTGWSTDGRVLSQVEIPAGYDLLVCRDYRRPIWRPLARNYDEVVIVGWSFGVTVAEMLYGEISSQLNVTGMFAVNGSRWPVDDERGIPEEIFNGTLESLDDRSLKKFRIRIAGGMSEFRAAEERLTTDLELEELRAELRQFHYGCQAVMTSAIWDCAFISENDRIFPPENLKRAWQDTPVAMLSGEAHLPDFLRLFKRIIKNKNTIGLNFERRQSSYDGAAVVQQSLVQQILKELNGLNTPFQSILEVGSGTGCLSKLIKENFTPRHLTLMDLSAVPPLEGAEYLSGDVEVIGRGLPSETFDLCVSGSTLQWLHSPTRVLSGIYASLKPGGVCAITTFLNGTFNEMTALSGEELLYFTEPQWLQIARRAGFELMKSDEGTTVLRFESVREVLAHVKSTGVNSLSGKTKSYREIKRIIENYPTLSDGTYPLTYRTLTLILRK